MSNKSVLNKLKIREKGTTIHVLSKELFGDNWTKQRWGPVENAWRFEDHIIRMTKDTPFNDGLFYYYVNYIPDGVVRWYKVDHTKPYLGRGLII